MTNHKIASLVAALVASLTIACATGPSAGTGGCGERGLGPTGTPPLSPFGLADGIAGPECVHAADRGSDRISDGGAGGCVPR